MDNNHPRNIQLIHIFLCFCYLDFPKILLNPGSTDGLELNMFLLSFSFFYKNNDTISTSYTITYFWTMNNISIKTYYISFIYILHIFSTLNFIL